MQVWIDYQVRREAVARAMEVVTRRKLPTWPEKVHLPITSQWLETAARAGSAAQSFVNQLSPLRADINEHYLFHGTNEYAAESIVQQAFKLSKAGSNAGTLYGRGIYLAESCCKSDEYSMETFDGTRSILVCRAILGHPYYTAEHFPNVGELEAECGFRTGRLGKHHCVLGDREKFRGTFREFIFYDSALVYPEFLVSYRHVREKQVRKNAEAEVDA